MPLDRARAEEEPAADLGVREPVAGEPGDLPLLGRQLVARLGRPLADLLAGRRQLAPSALGEGFHADRDEQVVGRSQLLPGVDAAILPPQPLAVEQVRPSQLGASCVRPSRSIPSR